MQSLTDRIRYVEHHAVIGANDVIGVGKYQDRFLFEDVNGAVHVIQAVAGVKTFPDRLAAEEAINRYPNKYVVNVPPSAAPKSLHSRTEVTGDPLEERVPANIKKDDRVRITGIGLRVNTGTVIDAHWWRGDGWYIELTWDQGLGYGYWKQGQDGGHVALI